MVREEVVEAGIRDPRVAAALREVPRHLFVAPHLQRHAYFDMALPIGHGQTISPPYVVAFMTQHLDPQSTDKVLEIGTGSGYQAAVLSHLVAEVYSIEIVEPLGRKAAETLKSLDYTNVHTRIGDGYEGWPEEAPFDKIIVTCSPEDVPPKLIEQLREGGRMVIPLGERYQQSLYLLKKVNGKLEPEALEATFFVPMTGEAESRRRVLDGEGLPEMVNGSFEQADDQGRPAGWYYVRQARVERDARAPGGEQVLVFINDTPGRGAQALQSIAMNGRRVREIEIELWIEARRIRPGPTPQHVPHLELNFYDEQRALVGTGVLGPWRSGGSWLRQQKRIEVPSSARLAVLAVGLFGATGQLAIDQVSVRVLKEDAP